MQGTMMDEPLLLSRLITHAASAHDTTEIAAREIDGTVFRYTYYTAERRARRLAEALTRLGVKHGDRVGTLAWNTYRHFEMFYGVSGSGAVLHTINPRLFREQLVYIINHCEDDWLFFDQATVDIVRDLAKDLNTVKGYCLMDAESVIPADLDLPGLCAYESLIEASDDDYHWPEFDERSASSICYTSGTTGKPKGVVYTHRAMMLSALTLAQRDFLGANENGRLDVALGLSPMFHGNAWQLPYLGPLLGMKLVWPGRHYDGKSIVDLARQEKANLAFGVPTFWIIIADYLDESGLKLPDLVTGLSSGAAPPRWLGQKLKDEYGIDLLNVWGMTECLGASIGSLKPGHNNLSDDEKIDYMRRSGRPGWSTRIRVVDESGKPVPRDGRSLGHLEAKGPFIAAEYYKAEEKSPLSNDGWFQTGDIAVWDRDGYFEIRDRAKDVIKSGGEWISSVDIESAVLAHPEISQAAVIAISHPHWQERPLLVCARKEPGDIDEHTVLEFLDSKLAKWQMPDAVAFVDKIPSTATGKVMKAELREQMLRRGYEVIGGKREKQR